jgi:hypothetical protein
MTTMLMAVLASVVLAAGTKEAPGKSWAERCSNRGTVRGDVVMIDTKLSCSGVAARVAGNSRRS